MRILFVLVRYHPYIGGAELISKRLAEGLARKGHDVKVITSRLPGTSRTEEMRGVAIERVWVPRLGGQYAFSISSLAAIIGQARHYDLVHTSSYYSSLSAFLGAKVAGRRVVLTCYEVLGKQWRLVRPDSLMSWAARIVEKLMVVLPYDKYVAISQATRADLLEEGANAANIRVIYPGVDDFCTPNGLARTGELREICHICPNDFLYLYYGRPGITKGIEYLVRAAPKVQRQIPSANLVLIIADEPRENYVHIRHLVDELKSTCNIHLVPQVPLDRREQLARYLLDADCIVIPSLTEGFGLTTVEACALGIPVVVTRVGAIPEVVFGRHILVEPGSADAVAEGVVRAWSEQYDYLPPKEFSWTRMVDEYERLYKELVG